MMSEQSIINRITPQNMLYQHGFLMQPDMLDVREEDLGMPDGYVSFHWLERFRRSRYPADANLAVWSWKVLLRDMVFFKLMYPGFSITGRPYELDVRHILTHQTREEWLDATHDCDALMNPLLWMIGKQSLRVQYYLLYVHDLRWDGYNLCRDSFRHQRYAPPLVHAGAYIQSAKQGKVQGLDACIYSFLREWILTWVR